MILFSLQCILLNKETNKKCPPGLLNGHKKFPATILEPDMLFFLGLQSLILWIHLGYVLYNKTLKFSSKKFKPLMSRNA